MSWLTTWRNWRTASEPILICNLRCCFWSCAFSRKLTCRFCLLLFYDLLWLKLICLHTSQSGHRCMCLVICYSNLLITVLSKIWNKLLLWSCLHRKWFTTMSFILLKCKILLHNHIRRMINHPKIHRILTQWTWLIYCF